MATDQNKNIAPSISQKNTAKDKSNIQSVKLVLL